MHYFNNLFCFGVFFGFLRQGYSWVSKWSVNHRMKLEIIVLKGVQRELNLNREQPGDLSITNAPYKLK